MHDRHGRHRVRVAGGRLAVVAAVAAASLVAAPPSGSTTPTPPAPGRYTYGVTGSYRIGIPPFVVSLPLPASAVNDLSYARDCGVTVTTSSNSSGASVYCPSDTALVALYRSTETIPFLFWSLTTTTTCSPGADLVRDGVSPGDAWPMSCSTRTEGIDNTTFTVSGTVTYVGEETLTIGGESVTAYHGRSECAITGGRTGTYTQDVWIDDHGLPLKTVTHQESSGAAWPHNYQKTDMTATLQSRTPAA